MISDLQREIGVKPDGRWGDITQSAYLCQPRRLYIDFDEMRMRRKQREGAVAIVSYCNKLSIPPQVVAYLLATAWHETAHTMQPLEEYGRGRSRPYGKWYRNSRGVLYGHRNSRGDAYTRETYPHLYYGRGLVQLTWLDNYLRAGERIGVDIASDPGLACEMGNAVKILVHGSMDGWFTGVGVGDFVEWGTHDEFCSARRVINGTDCAAKIAKHANMFMESLCI